ncbi:TetR family transcriptional regulator [Chitinophaga niastensis]|uniref:TetR family transcriptional regulator n=1 Tax=Chitinophaga niastensis TaxID=536980 RepID=A0A2P8HPW8_CHINA|nr:TetR/AcrR family transcriptional regulator [Chitinophaga niastensis]PSL48252.1 TetR family transcriptional regulator [Chitinophaga niastensis]
MATEKNTEAQIIAAAKKIFMQKGLSGARMQDIADEAGINKAMLHYYYRSKDKLFDIIFEEAADNVFKVLSAILKSDMPFAEMVAAIVENYINNLIKNPYLPMFVLNEIHQNPERIINRFSKSGHPPDVQAFVEKVMKVQKKGEIRKVSPLQLLLNIVSMCIFPFAAKPLLQTIAGLDEIQYRMMMEERKKQVVDFIMAALKP